MAVKIEANIPVVGVPKAAYLSKSQFGDKVNLKLRGKWDGSDQSDVFVNAGVCLRQAIDCGFLKIVSGDPEQDDPDNVKLRVEGNPRIQILRTGSGPDTRTTISLANGAAPSRPASPSANGHSSEKIDARQHVERLKATMAKCIEHGIELAAKLPTDPEAPRCVAMALFIERMKHGLLSPVPHKDAQPAAPPPMTDEQASRVDELGQQLGYAREKLEHEMREASGAADWRRMTTEQAAKAIARLESLVQTEIERKAATAKTADEEIPFAWLMPWLTLATAALACVA